MFVKKFRIGVQSWCFRTFKTTDEVIAAVQASGLDALELCGVCLLYTSPSPRDRQKSRMPSSA